MADTVKIIFESDVNGINKASSALDDLAKSEKAATDQFKKDNEVYVNYSKKRLEEIAKEEAAIERLRMLRKKSFNAEDIKFYNNEIKLAKQNIQLLGGSYQTVSKGAKEALQQQVQLNQALKQSNANVAQLGGTLSSTGSAALKAFGSLRTLANILPGIGISGLILFGYEALINLFESFSSSLHENEEALMINKKAIDALIDSRERLREEITNNEAQTAVELGLITERDAKIFSAREAFNKTISDLDKQLVQIEKDISKELDIAGTTNIDSKIEKQNELKKRLAEVYVEQKKNRADAENLLNSELELIQVQAVNEDKARKEKEAKQRLEKQRKNQDDSLKLQQQYLNDLLKSLKIANDKQVILSEDGSKDRLDAQVNAIQQEQTFILETTVLTEQQRANLIAENENKILKLKLDFAQKQKSEALKLAKEQADEELKIREEEFEEEIRLAGEQADLELAQQQAFEDASFDISHQTTQLISALNDASTDAELQQAQEKLDKKQITEEQFADEVTRIKRDAAKQDKLLNLFNIALNTAEGVIKYLSNPVTAPLVPFVIASGAIQAGVVAATPIPFAKGTKSVKGGQQGKDSVHALLMPDEMVIPVDKKRKYEPILNAIFDERISPELLNSMALKGNFNMTQNNSMDEYVVHAGMKRALRDGIVVKNMPKDKGGMSLMEYELLKRRGIA